MQKMPARMPGWQEERAQQLFRKNSSAIRVTGMNVTVNTIFGLLAGHLAFTPTL